MIESVVFFLLGGASYLVGRSHDRQADKLASIPRIREFKDLGPLLKSENRLMVALRGNVGSETPMNCEFSELQGVVVQKMVLKYFLERIKNEDEDEDEDKNKNKDQGEWRQDYEVLHSTSKQVPWYLDDGTFRVNVVGARSAEGFHCTAEYAVFEPSRSCHGVETLGDLEDLPYIIKGMDRQVLGVKRIERVLPIGTSLSVIGEAVKDGNGTICIQKPDGGGPFYVSPNPRTIDQLIEARRGEARYFYGGSVVCTLLGVADIGLHLL